VRFERAGYVSVTRPVTPRADAAVDVTLRRRARDLPAGGGEGFIVPK
jgi:hypothetical protein